jgi:hypothetical protein
MVKIRVLMQYSGMSRRAKVCAEKHLGRSCGRQAAFTPSAAQTISQSAPLLALSYELLLLAYLAARALGNLEGPAPWL